MVHILPAVLASTVRDAGIIIAALVGVGFVVYVVLNIRAGKAEIGSEIELAPNRKPYYNDEQLEGPRLNRALLTCLVLLAVVSLGLPLYWLGEPARMQGAVEAFDASFVAQGERLFAPAAEGGFGCADCHGPEGVGGVASHTLVDAQGEFVATVNWMGPALNTILLRQSEEEVAEPIIYGRPFSPMPAFGEAGGGPLISQQIDNLIAYMWTIQLTPEQARAEVETGLRRQLGLAEDAEIDYTDKRVGEALFNLGQDDGFAGGAFSCARCHTPGWSLLDQTALPAGADITAFVDHPDGAGAFGPNLRTQIVPSRFFVIEDLVQFLKAGSEFGVGYGQLGQGTGRMPGFGDNPNTEEPADGMMTEEMIRAIAEYVLSLDPGAGVGGAP